MRSTTPESDRRGTGVSAFGPSDGSDAQDLGDRLEEEEFAPHHRLVDAQLLVEVIDAVLEHALPARGVPGEVAVGAEGVEDRQRGVAVAAGAASGRAVRLGEVPEARGGDRGGRAVVDPVGAGGDVEVPGGDEALGAAVEEVVGVALGDGQVGRVVRVA